MDIEHWRNQIDELNQKLLELLNERAACALEIGKIKQGKGDPIYAPDRETKILNRIKELNMGPMTSEAAQRIFRQIIDETRRMEQDIEDEN